MNDDLTRHLDGEIPGDALDADQRSEAVAWDRMVEAFRVEAPSGQAPPWIESAVMAQIEALPEPSLGRRVWAWVTRPQPIRVSPMTGGLVAAVFAAVLLWPSPPEVTGPVGTEPSPVRAASTGAEAAVVYVQFRLEAPGARSVSVAGDFTEWEASYSLEDPDRDGVWTARVPVEPGVHAYMFLVDGTEWATDPEANRYQDDGFGNRNAVLAVASSE